MKSSTLLSILFIFSLITVILLSFFYPATYSNILPKNALNEGPEWEKINTTKERRIDNKYTTFTYITAKPQSGTANGCCADVTELDKIVQIQIKKEKRNHSKSEDGNKKWYWNTLPVDTNDYIILIWQDEQKKKYEWIAVKNTPTFWYTIKKDGSINLVLDGQQLVCEWHIYNKYLEIRVKNPPNIRGWTPFEFWYSFAESKQKMMKPTLSASWLSLRFNSNCYSEI